jgi:hypothetical protein
MAQVTGRIRRERWGTWLKAVEDTPAGAQGVPPRAAGRLRQVDMDELDCPRCISAAPLLGLGKSSDGESEEDDGEDHDNGYLRPY